LVAETGDNNKQPTNAGRSLLRDLAHELRDALSPVASSIDLLRLRNYEPDVGRVVSERVERGLRRAFATVDAFVLAEQSENGTLVLDTAPCRLQQILQAARELTSPQVLERCVFAAASQDAVVKADLMRAAQVVSALLEHGSGVALAGTMLQVHAAAASKRPQIRVHCRVDTQTAPGEGWFRSYRGGGLGSMALRTARGIMTLQYGSLEVTMPAPGECEFLAIFEAAASTTTPAMAEPARASPGRDGDVGIARTGTRIMIVDDSAEVRRAYREALLPLGYSVTEAANADQALAVIDAGTPDVALIDIHLPGVNGYRLAQSLRARSGAAIRLVMLSGMALDPTTLRLSREAGFDDCLDKMAGPLALHSLLQGRRNAGS
jgi:two-component system, sensor histidine kinase